MAIYSGFSHWKWPFSIAMLNYQRVYIVIYYIIVIYILYIICYILLLCNIMVIYDIYIYTHIFRLMRSSLEQRPTGKSDWTSDLIFHVKHVASSFQPKKGLYMAKYWRCECPSDISQLPFRSTTVGDVFVSLVTSLLTWRHNPVNRIWLGP